MQSHVPTEHRELPSLGQPFFLPALNGGASQRTAVILPLSAAAYREIRATLLAAGYGHAFQDIGTREEVIDMHGIAVQREPDEDEDDG